MHTHACICAHMHACMWTHTHIDAWTHTWALFRENVQEDCIPEILCKIISFIKKKMWTVLLGLNSAVWRKQFNRAINSPMMWKCNCCCRCFWRSSCICNTTEGRHQSPWNYIHHAPSILCSHICNTSTAHALHSTADASVTSGLHSLCSLSCLQLSGVESPSYFAAVQQKWNVVFVAVFFFF